MEHLFAKRMHTVPRSFIREILKVTQKPEIISFAGGLPNPALFPVEDLRKAADLALSNPWASTLQYSTTEGVPALRELIAERYDKRFGHKVDPDSIIVTTGSQQALDLLGKVFIDEGDPVLMERPGYLGAIQAFSIFCPSFCDVPLEADGPGRDALATALDTHNPKMFYTVPNFQNPSGLSYGRRARKDVVELLKDRDTVFVEDDPYGELRYSGEDLRPMSFDLERGVLLGTFSKIAAPGLRVGWVVAPPELHTRLVTAKQAADLHTSTMAQRTLASYMSTFDLDAHIERIRECYGKHLNIMLEAIAEHFPPEVRCTRPEGGMFLWATLPGGCSAKELFEQAIERNVAFVPGMPFHIPGGEDPGTNTMRLNFSNAEPDSIREGIKRLGACLKGFLDKASC